MNALWLGPSGGTFSYPAEIGCCRWGGGAEPGKYHVFGMKFRGLSCDCVVDDFGNLVVVS